MAGVQFFGKEAVLQAYNSRGIDTWAIFDGKNMVFPGEGEELLSDILDKLEGGSAAYTLAVYNNGIPSNQLTNRTENNGAFRFKLDKDARAVGNVQRAGSGGDPVLQEINTMLAAEVRDILRERINGVRKDEPKEETWTDILKETIRTNPGVVVQTIGAIKDFFNTGNVSAFAPVALGAVKPQIAGMVNETTQHSAEGVDIDQDRWEAVLQRLENADPDILIHLEKLATMAEKEPSKYKMALSFL